jgi:Asp-tRNAAsn/Glu-tRNAGln amidotransferase A subunit and related amidases
MDLCATPAVELARLIRARDLSAAELLAAVLARITEANPAVNAIVTLAAEQAAVRPRASTRRPPAARSPGRCTACPSR